MKRYAVISEAKYIQTVPNVGPVEIINHKVENVVIWDGESAWSPGPDFIVVELPDDSPVSIGWVAVEVDGVWEFSEN